MRTISRDTEARTLCTKKKQDAMAQHFSTVTNSSRWLSGRWDRGAAQFRIILSTDVIILDTRYRTLHSLCACVRIYASTRLGQRNASLRSAAVYRSSSCGLTRRTYNTHTLSAKKETAPCRKYFQVCPSSPSYLSRHGRQSRRDMRTEYGKAWTRVLLAARRCYAQAGTRDNVLRCFRVVAYLLRRVSLSTGARVFLACSLAPGDSYTIVTRSPRESPRDLRPD